MNLQSIISLVGDYPLYVQMLALMGIAMVIATFLVLIARVILRATNKRVESHTLELIQKRLRGPLFWVLSFLLTTIFFDGISFEDTTKPVYFAPALGIVRTLLYISGALLIIRIIGVAADTVRYRFDHNDKDNLKERKILTQLQYIERIAIIIVGVVTVAFILLQFEGVRSIGTGILTSAGVTGIIVGLAAQKSIANLLAGFQIAFTQPIRIDDKLIINGEFGQVDEITLTYVVLRLWDERRMIIPLQYFIDNPFQNWTHTSSQLIGNVILHTDYSLPVAAIREELEKYLPTREEWDQRVTAVQVTDLTDRTMQIRVLVSSIDSGSTFNLRCAVREHLISFIQKNYPDSLPRTRLDLPEGTPPTAP